MNREGPQVLDILARPHPHLPNTTLSPVKPGDTAQTPPSSHFHKSPCPVQEQALEKEMSGNAKGKKDKDFFFFSLKFLLSHCRARAIIQPDLLTSIKFWNQQKRKTSGKRNVWYCVCETQSKGWQFAIIQSSELRKWLRVFFFWWGTWQGGKRGIQLRPSDCTMALIQPESQRLTSTWTDTILEHNYLENYRSVCSVSWPRTASGTWGCRSSEGQTWTWKLIFTLAVE